MDTTKKSTEQLALVAAAIADCKTPLFKARQLVSSLRHQERPAESDAILKKLEEAINVLAAGLEKIEAAAIQPATATREKALQGLRVLLADDEDIAAAMTVRMLERNGASVVRAHNGMTATELTATRHFDLILMDIQMPTMDGLTASKVIRYEQKKTTPIIALTAGKVEDNNSYAEAGMNNAIAKPYKEQKLVEAILQCLEGDIQTHPTDDTTQTKRTLYSLDKLTSMGDKNFVLRMLNLFVEQVPASVTKLEDAYQACDFESVKYIAHRIRPALLNMGITAEKETSEIERLAEAGTKSAALEQLIEKLESTTIEVVAEVRKYLDQQ
jgi:CheY-like chemotaxis protein/HPt (histidine-containing phosphotransfer) domain-containing protein